MVMAWVVVVVAGRGVVIPSGSIEAVGEGIKVFLLHIECASLPIRDTK